jgi:hypothetical protein
MESLLDTVMFTRFAGGTFFLTVAIYPPPCWAIVARTGKEEKISETLLVNL